MFGIGYSGFSFGGPTRVSSSGSMYGLYSQDKNQASMNYKHIKQEDKQDKLMVRVNINPCYCIYTYQADGSFERSKCLGCSMVEQKPHYKWSWKLNKAVRV